MSKKHKQKYKIIIAVTFIMLLFELTLRIFWSQPLPGFSKGLFHKKNDLLLLQPDVLGQQDSREFNVAVEGNSYGYRKGTWPKEKLKNKPILWLFGDSFGFGWGVESKETASAHLNKTQKLQVYNLAIPGDEFKDYSKRYKKMRNIIPRAKVIILLIFDKGFCVPLLKARQKKSKKDEYQEKIRFRKFLLQSHIIRLIRRTINATGLSDLVANKMGSEELLLYVMREIIEIHKKESFEDKAWKNSYAELKNLLTSIRMNGESILMVRIVPPFILNKAEEKTLLHNLKSNKNVYDFEFLDAELQKLTPNYFRFVAPNKKDFYYRYDSHLTAKGQMELAKFLEDKISIILKK